MHSLSLRLGRLCGLALLSVFVLLATVHVDSVGVDARRAWPTKQELLARQHASLHNLLPRANPEAAGAGARKPPPKPPVKPASKLSFANPRAKPFLVDGKAIPEVNWDVGPSYAGLMPISSKPDETRKLFFWFFPPGPQGSADDLIFWTNGGPGCSSLEGLLQENGPISWQFGQAKPTKNAFSWTNLSSVLWVEQPVGTGFSQGEANIHNEDELAAQLVGFFQQFLEVFNELKGNKLYLTGESYAGMYLPYIANYIYDRPQILDLDLQGIWLGNPAMSWDVIQSELGTLAFVQKYQYLFGFDTAFMDKLTKMSGQCGYTSFMQQHVTYPPKGKIPLPGKDVTFDEGCDVWGMVYDQALLINPAWNLYRIFDVYPVLWDVLGNPGTNPDVQSPIYFDRADVKKAIHAPANVAWEECTGRAKTFPFDDASEPSALNALPKAIERSPKGVVIMHGMADFLLLADGTRTVIQNMTWSGAQGFRTPIKEYNFIVDSMPGGAPMGNVHSERGLTYYEVALSGHMVPQFSPWSAYQGMQYLMGRRTKP